ncbi:DUF1559 domain-containing protein [Rariglobus hedericola]|uniref:DUF1559 domain-containing protein n=1 Tax=Rariglobus hedericola TaxID=2597822 RepID=A0A556QRP7_9BACT|nr:DUF1559 domain-containing protein [Rariglobus hedericola]TSJ79315.1 DUF1559 domain-containing protein [Rariglobus hedericola]
MFRSTPRKSPVVSARPRHAFTLVELLSVIAIVGILAAIILPVVGSMRNTARSTQCMSNLRQIGVAFNGYAADNRGLYPAPRLMRQSDMPAGYTVANPPPLANRTLENWSVEISPYVTNGSFKLNGTATGAQSVGDLKDTVSIGHCPAYDQLFNASQKLTAQSNYSTAGYGMNWGLKVGGAKIPDVKLRFRAVSIDNPGRTVLVGDSSDYYLDSTPTPTTDPAKPDGYNASAPKRHGKGANYLFVDGRVGMLTPEQALVTLNPTF